MPGISLRIISRIVLAFYLLGLSWSFSFLYYKVIDIMSNRVSIPITNLASVSDLVSTSNASRIVVKSSWA